ncbi:MAG: hypothetical protein OEY23_06335 [Acidimicrobiia bacterium]|nr:hypothetical protein [Acidimicrobiia bacterium]
MTSTLPDEYLLLAGSDAFSRKVREALDARHIPFVEVAVATGPDVVVPTLVVRDAARGTDVTFAGYGRITQEFLAQR